MTRGGGPFDQGGGAFDQAGGTFDQGGGAFDQGGGPFEQGGGPFEQGGGPFEKAELSSRGVFEDWSNRGGDDGTRGGSVEESQKTTEAPPPSPVFPHAIPDDVQFFEPSLVMFLSSLSSSVHAYSSS